jgi:cell division protein FtsL
MSSALNALLAAALVVTSLGLVRSSYEARRLTDALDRAGTEARRLAQESDRLDAQRQAQATHSRIESVARERLGMRLPTPGVMIVVDDAGGSAR